MNGPQVARYEITSDSPRNPLGGREADGFGEWITTTYLQMRDLRDQFHRPEDDNIPARMVREAADHYGRVRRMWFRADGEADVHPRDSLEIMLIRDVMQGYHLAEYARERTAAGDQRAPDKRAYTLMAAEYVRTCLILAQYTGVQQTDVSACGADQGKLSALRG